MIDDDNDEYAKCLRYFQYVADYLHLCISLSRPKPFLEIQQLLALKAALKRYE